MKLAVIGASGRMGRAVVRLAIEAADVSLVGAAAAPDAREIGRDAGEVAGAHAIGTAVSPDVTSALLGADVAIDFSFAGATAEVARACERAKVALVCGTTGVDAGGRSALEAAARRVPVLVAPNMSLGVEVLAALVREAVAKLGPGFDVEIVETHHRAKVDAPSGTALRLVAAAREARADLRARAGRDGQVGPRPDDELGVFAVRGGDVIGDHVVHFLGAGERLELVHRATNRDLFAHGALRAARWLVGKPAAIYRLADTLGG